MSKHLEYVRVTATSSSLQQLMDDVKKARTEKASLYNPFGCISTIRQDHIVLNNQSINFKRIFIKSNDSIYCGKYANVGWVLACEVEACMICLSKFGVFNKRNHCRACGFVLCNSCTTEKAVIAGMNLFGEMKVCTKCYRGEVHRNIFYNLKD